MEKVLSLYIHLKNQYAQEQGYSVIPSANSVVVMNRKGDLIIMIVNGQDVGAEMGARDRLDLSPLPKVACHVEHGPGGKGVVPHPQAQERLVARKSILNDKGVAQSIPELKKAGFVFNEKREIESAPKSA